MFNFIFNYIYFNNKYNKISTDENVDITSCMLYDVNNDKVVRDYMDDFIGYKLLEDNKAQFYIIIDNDTNNKKTLNADIYYNKDTESYYYEYNNDFNLKHIKGSLGFYIKKNNIILGNINFKYKLNDPKFNSDIVKIISGKNILYLFLKRDENNKHFHFYKIIFTIFK